MLSNVGGQLCYRMLAGSCAIECWRAAVLSNVGGQLCYQEFKCYMEPYGEENAYDRKVVLSRLGVGSMPCVCTNTCD